MPLGSEERKNEMYSQTLFRSQERAEEKTFGWWKRRLSSGTKGHFIRGRKETGRRNGRTAKK